MPIYTFAAAALSALAGLIIAIFTKRNKERHYNKLDKAGIFTNLFLVLVYLCLAPMYMYLGATAAPAHSGLLGIIGWVVIFIIASSPIPCWLGLGFSAALRKKGRSMLGFAMQFAGFGGIILALLLTLIFTGNLLVPDVSV